MRNHLWCSNDPRGSGIDDDDDAGKHWYGGGGGGGGKGAGEGGGAICSAQDLNPKSLDRVQAAGFHRSAVQRVFFNPPKKQQQQKKQQLTMLSALVRGTHVYGSLHSFPTTTAEKGAKPMTDAPVACQSVVPDTLRDPRVGESTVTVVLLCQLKREP